MARRVTRSGRLWLGLRRTLGTLTLLAAAGAFVYALAPRAEAAAPRPRALTIGGVELARGNSTMEEAERIAAELRARSLALSLGDDVIRLSLADTGLEVDLERLSALVAAANAPDSSLSRHMPAGDAAIALPAPLTGGHTRLLERLAALRADFDRDAKDARIDFDAGEIHQARRGRHLDVWGTLEAIELALKTGRPEVAARIEQSPPSVSVQGSPDALFGAVLGEFSTHYNAMARERTANLRAAARRIRGLILPPGGVFDFNEVVGERSRAHGFVPATVIAGGELVDGVGGGACQIAGSLHAAAFFAGLPILDRHPHSRPSSYIKMGLDAAVSYPRLNLRFSNDLSTPVALDITVAGGLVTGRVMGPRRSRVVSFVRRIDAFATYSEEEQQDPSLPSGVRVLAQRGVPGFTVTRFRILRDPVAHMAERQRMDEDTYPPTTQIWHVGTGPRAADGYEPPAGDAHGEYRADEYVVMTRGPNIEEDAEVHRAGRTGSPGWTAREGMPQPAAD